MHVIIPERFVQKRSETYRSIRRRSPSGLAIIRPVRTGESAMLLSVTVAAADVIGKNDRLLGLQTLIAPDAVGTGALSRSGGNVAIRTLAASRRAVCCCLGYGAGGDGDGEGDDGGGKEEEEGGCWVIYGRRRRLRRLPPLIPSLRRAGRSPWALTRTRTADGRVVVLREPAPSRGRLLATKLEGRLVLDLVERDDHVPVPPPRRQRRHPPHLSIAPEADVVAPAAAADEEDASAADVLGSALCRDVPAAVRAPTMTSSPVGSASASPLPAPVGCFEAVIRTSPLSKMPMSLPRMVH